MRSVKENLERDFVCVKCRAHGGTVEEVGLPSGPFSRMFPVGSTRYFAVSCSLCGYTEFYNLAVAVRAEEQESAPEPDLVKGAENA